MFKWKFHGRVLLIGAVLASLPARAQESGALIDVLIRKGILTQQEAEEIRAEFGSEIKAPPTHVDAGGKATERLSLGMRMQLQYASLDTMTRLRRMNTFTKWYASANWYLAGNDLKLQLGAVYGKTQDTPAGAPSEAKAVGVRSQMQVQF
jgi:hypothetical protein